MNKKGNFWFWFGLVLLIGFFIFLFVNLSKFGDITHNINFLVISFIVALIAGILIFISAVLSRKP
jgi:uncharacterized membrane protein YhaH (DUF805 family)